MKRKSMKRRNNRTRKGGGGYHYAGEGFKWFDGTEIDLPENIGEAAVVTTKQISNQEFLKYVEDGKPPPIKDRSKLFGLKLIELGIDEEHSDKYDTYYNLQDFRGYTEKAKRSKILKDILDKSGLLKR
jgi:hypothetical protein